MMITTTMPIMTTITETTTPTATGTAMSGSLTIFGPEVAIGS